MQNPVSKIFETTYMKDSRTFEAWEPAINLEFPLWPVKVAKHFHMSFMEFDRSIRIRLHHHIEILGLILHSKL